jgi:hypothetical protein
MSTETAENTAAEQQEPWPIANALACLRETRDRDSRSDDPARNETIKLAMNYAIEVVKGINSIRDPRMSASLAADRAVREFARNVGRALQDLGQRFEDIGNGEQPWVTDEEDRYR